MRQQRVIRKKDLQKQLTMLGIEKPKARKSSIQLREELEQKFAIGELGWSEDFQEFLDMGYKWTQAAYIAWRSTPPALRQPRTLAEFAQILGVNRHTTNDWNHNPTITALIKERRLKPIYDNAKEIMDALIESAKTPDYKNYQDRKIALEILKIYVPGQSLLDEIKKQNTGSLEGKSDEELEQLIRFETDQIRENIFDEEDDDEMSGNIIESEAVDIGAGDDEYADRNNFGTEKRKCGTWKRIRK